MVKVCLPNEAVWGRGEGEAFLQFFESNLLRTSQWALQKLSQVIAASLQIVGIGCCCCLFFSDFLFGWLLSKGVGLFVFDFCIPVVKSLLKFGRWWLLPAHAGSGKHTSRVSTILFTTNTACCRGTRPKSTVTFFIFFSNLVATECLSRLWREKRWNKNNNWNLNNSYNTLNYVQAFQVRPGLLPPQPSPHPFFFFKHKPYRKTGI